MQFKIDNATIIGFSQQGQFFDGDFRFGNRRIISLECFSTDITNESEVSSTAIRELIELSKTEDYSRVHINGISFDFVRFNSFSIGSDDWVRGAPCNIELEVYEEGTIESYLGGDNYKGLDFQELAHFLDEFSEDFDFSRTENSKNYTHSISLKFSEAALIQKNTLRLNSVVALAKEFAGILFNKDSGNRPDFPFTEQQLSSIYKTFDNNYHRTINEEYDNINNTCTFTENFQSYDDVSADNSYSVKSTQNFEYGENGIISVSEQGEILGLLENNYEAASSALDTVITEAKTRLSNIFNEYKETIKAFATCSIPDLAGSSRSISEGRTLNIFEGIISYNIQLTNDPSKLDNVNYSYTTTVNLDGDFFTVSEDGNIEGIKEPVAKIQDGDSLDYQKYDQALSYYESINSTIDTRLKSAITNPSPEYVTNQENISPYKGTISYSRSFSNAPRYSKNNGFSKQITVEESSSAPVVRHTVENILNSPLYKDQGGAQLVQLPKNTDNSPVGYSLGSKSNRIKIVGKRNSDLETLLNLAKDEFTPELNYLEECSYDFNDENSMLLNLNLTWK